MKTADLIALGIELRWHRETTWDALENERSARGAAEIPREVRAVDPRLRKYRINSGTDAQCPVLFRLLTDCWKPGDFAAGTLGTGHDSTAMTARAYAAADWAIRSVVAPLVATVPELADIADQLAQTEVVDSESARKADKLGAFAINEHYAQVLYDAPGGFAEIARLQGVIRAGCMAAQACDYAIRAERCFAAADGSGRAAQAKHEDAVEHLDRSAGDAITTREIAEREDAAIPPVDRLLEMLLARAEH